MTAYTLERTDDIPLEFEGELVAEESSEDGTKPRWTVLRLYKVADHRGYVVESLGVSTVPGEVTLRSATHCPTISDTIAKLRKSDASKGVRRSYLPDMAWDLLVSAHEGGHIVFPTTERV